MTNFNFWGKLIRQFWGKLIRQSTKTLGLQFVTWGGGSLYAYKVNNVTFFHSVKRIE